MAIARSMDTEQRLVDVRIDSSDSTSLQERDMIIIPARIMPNPTN